MEKKKPKKVNSVRRVRVLVSLPLDNSVAVHPLNKRNPNKEFIMVDIVLECGFAFPTKISCENRNQQSQKYDLPIDHVTRVREEVQRNPKKILRNDIRQSHIDSYIGDPVWKCIVDKIAILSVSTQSLYVKIFCLFTTQQNR